MAVSALNQAFIHLVMERHIERWLDVGVALIAELRLGGLQQLVLRVPGMDAVAACAAHPRLGMRSAREVGMRPRVAAQAGLTHLRRSQFGELLDLGHIAATLDVGLPWSVAALASRPRTMRQGDLVVRVVLELLGHLDVAGLAYFRADEIRSEERRVGTASSY